MTIKISSAKAKGRRLQQWVAERISAMTGIPWGPDEEIRSREMGQSGVDVVLTGRARKLFPFFIECKAQETWSVPAWIRQAKANADSPMWLLVCKRNREDPVVMLDAGIFFDLVELRGRGGLGE